MRQVRSADGLVRSGGDSTADLDRRGRIFGLFFLGTFVFSIPGALLYGPVLKANYVLGVGADHRVSLGAFLEILTALCNIATAVVLYPVGKRVSRSVSLGYVASRTLESTLILVGAIGLLSVVTMRHAFRTGTGADAATYAAVGRSLVAIHDWTFLIGPTFCASMTGILVGYLMYRSGLVPRPWAVLGLVGGALCFVGATVRLFTTNGHTSAVTTLLTVPEIVWELFLGIYCTFKGFRASAALDDPSLRAKTTS